MNWQAHTGNPAHPPPAARRASGACRIVGWRPVVAVWLALPLLCLCLDGRALGARHRLIADGGETLAALAPEESGRQRSGMLEHARRAKRVTLPVQALQGGGIRRSDILELPLFDETALTARVEEVAVDAAGTAVIRCRVDGHPLGFVVLTAQGGRCMAAIEVPELGLHQQIAHDAARGAHYLLDFGGGYPDTLAHAAPLEPPAAADAPAAAEPPPAATGPNDPATVDVMVVYTPAARVWADLHGGIGNGIAQALARSQLAHDNSQTGITKRLVHAAEIAYAETGNSSTDLARLQHPGDGHMDEVHCWRAGYGADLVVLLTKTEDAGGIGFVLTCPAGSPAYGFSIARVQQVAVTFTMAHEMAHNMGCDHHKQQTVQPGPGLFSYAAGWRWVSPGGQRRCDLMTYPEGRYFADAITHTAVAYFSSPVVSYDGAVTGDPEHGDNRRCLMEVKHVVAAYQHPGPPNDSFASAAALSGASGSATGCNIGATKEPGEPDHAGNPGGKSVWWQWTAPASGLAAIDTTGSGFDTLLAVYTGDAVGVLAEIASSGGGAPARVVFPAVAGATYRIAVDGADGAAGKVALNWAYPPQIVVTPAALRVPEGGSATIMVRLSAAPAANTTTVALEVSGDPDLSVGTTKLAFSATDWSSPQVVAITAAQDADGDDGSAVITCAAAGFASATVAVTEEDDDTTLTLVTGAGGMVSPGGTVLVTKGEPVPIRATPGAGYEFVHWEVTGGSATLARTNATATTVAITAPATVTATFAPFAEFARIPAGDFFMGRTGGDPDANAPPVTVETSAFLIGKHEVSKALWDEVRSWAAAHGYGDLAAGGGKAPDHPVHSISWWDAVKWCNARSERDGLTPVYHVAGAVMRSGTTAPTARRAADGYRLPTEAEWEKAARGGATGLRFPWGDTIDHHHANYRANHTAAAYDKSPYSVNTPHPDYNDGVTPFTAPVAAFWPNDYGLHGMAGNVMEWCWDWYGANTYVTGAADPQGPAKGTYKVYRGGGWRSTAPETRICYRRGYYTPGMAFNEIGFRLVRSANDDHGDTRMAATTLVPGTPAQGGLSDGDADCFAVPVPGPGLLICWTTGTTDTTGEIRDSSGAVLASHHDLLHPGDLSVLDANFRVSAQVVAGAHFVRVTGAPGDYTLHFKFIPAGAPLEISLFRIISGGHVILGLPTAAGTDYQLEWSPDLRHWTHLGRLAGTGGEVIAVLDRHAAVHPQRAVFRAYVGPLKPP